MDNAAVGRPPGGAERRREHQRRHGAADPEKGAVKPWQRKEWCIATVGADFVCAMEDVLDLYAEPSNPRRPVVCFDEKPIQLLEETRVPRPVARGQPALVDYEYRRKGTANLFIAIEPLAGWRQVTVTERRTRLDFAQQLKGLSEHYPEAERIRLVLDNLSTHTPACLYEAFPPEEARRLARRFEFHYTPKHGSWLNMAEAGLSVLSQQCLDRRIGHLDRLGQETAASTARRNSDRVMIHWRFTVHDARRKLSHLYPTKP